MSTNDKSLKPAQTPQKRGLSPTSLLPQSQDASEPCVTCKCLGCGTPDSAYVGEQFTMMYAQLNAQNKIIQDQSQFLQEFMGELLPLLKKIDEKLK